MLADKVVDETMTMAEEWFDVLSRLWLAYGKDVDADRLDLYGKMLNKLPLGLLELAIEQTVQDHGKYNNVPTVAEVWDAVKVVLHHPYDVDQAIEAWVYANFKTYTFGGVAVETE